ncbi:hypothetical protein NDU88_003786 [Pleurodeles waltl]|uniref:Uncharacterized protein n=1 Tax=Pleurodeles waltl TaxID=8319 RepID=A0AAV7TQR2_PLEWA|nr:hypothetical protein NDU88_003786 [Pleurodeles waltl]
MDPCPWRCPTRSPYEAPDRPLDWAPSHAVWQTYAQAPQHSLKLPGSKTLAPLSQTCTSTQRQWISLPNLAHHFTDTSSSLLAFNSYLQLCGTETSLRLIWPLRSFALHRLHPIPPR